MFVEEALGRFSGNHVRQYRPMIEAAQVAADEAKATLVRWVEAARRAGMSWTDVGELVGISKQAAQQRYGREPVPDAPFGTIVVVPGPTGATEQELLDREGAAGRELVGVDATRLLFRQTDRVWEHHRSVDPLDPAEMEAGGWAEAARWFVFAYYRRPGSGG
ncbi:hypothetical protein Q5H91_12530 [Sphingomonas sp. KR1UV-12]|uniref:Uncharacterized protein n=1 Tax=Sphingomonas aurea TaxID=3063994 RepID=A0ABT9EMJ8_9SPHN|nr:hypothetical protein [Sphingomonas sp. KR1UV-12]MDP1028042.1 hypothetical protein [Sphingomonas sp. KR1UV-12]